MMASQGKEGSMLAVDRGQWAWHDEKGELQFLSTSKSRASHSKPRSWLPMAAPPSGADSGNGLVTLEDVKRVAVKLIDEDTVRRTRRNTCKLFDTCYKTKEMNDFLWSTMIYYQSFREHKKALRDDNVHIAGSLGDDARATLERCRRQLIQSKVNLGDVYSKFILGLGHEESHHLQGGRSRVSRTQTDREFYEVLHEFMVFTLWITFGYKDWDIIHGELGRFFRTPQFNRDISVSTGGSDGGYIEVEGLGRISKASDQFLTYKVYYERPFVGMLREIHTKAHKSILPEPKDKYMWSLDTSYNPPRHEVQVLPSAWSPPERLGVIGESKARYDPDTLRCLEKESESESDDEESGGGAESLVSGIIEDDGESNYSF